MTKKIKYFVASSNSLQEERSLIRQNNDEKNHISFDRGIFYDLSIWEYFSGSMSTSGRKQNDYNNVIETIDIFILLASNKIGKYSEEEFDCAYELFKKTKKPKIHVYLKSIPQEETEKSLADFKEKMRTLEHFPDSYENKYNLWNKINKELDMYYYNYVHDSHLYDSLNKLKQSSIHSYLSLLAIIGVWNNANKNDLDLVLRLLNIKHSVWLNKAKDLLHMKDSPLEINGILWKVKARAEILEQIGTRILNDDLDRFKEVSVSALKNSEYSAELREGITEGIAILAIYRRLFKNCDKYYLDRITRSILTNVLEENFETWELLEYQLPVFAEIDPEYFLSLVEQGVKQESFKKLNHGIIRALEVLAWDSEYFVRVCAILCQIASKFKDEKALNNALEALITILLPWFPQTLASVDMRILALKTLFKENQDIAWKVIIKLLPGQQTISNGTYKPKFRKIILDDIGVSNADRQQQMLIYSNLAIEYAGNDINRLITLIDIFNKLPKQIIDKLLKKILTSEAITELPEEERLPLWEHLTKAIRELKRDNKKVNEIGNLEAVAKQIAPKDPFYFYRYLFTDNIRELYDKKDNRGEKEKIINEQRKTAIKEILQQFGMNKVIMFTENVDSPSLVGAALAEIDDSSIEKALLPNFLNTENTKYTEAIRKYIEEKYRLNGITWCDNLNREDWNPIQIGQFLAYLLFTEETWTRVTKWLGKDEKEYWIRASSGSTQINNKGIEKLNEYGRFNEAINCMCKMKYKKFPIDTNQCIKTLLSAPFFNEKTDNDNISDLIDYLQADPSVNEDDMLKIKRKYLNFLSPKTFEDTLAKEPELFSKAIKDMQEKDSAAELKANANNYPLLFYEWKTPPGMQKDESFDGEYFLKWFEQVKTLCEKSGHLNIAQEIIGEVLIHTPKDPSGLWINKTVAEFLNRDDSEPLRRAFCNELPNLPSNQADKSDMVSYEKYYKQAGDVENAGFYKFAASLKDLANDFKQKAEHYD